MNLLLVLLALINVEFSWNTSQDATGYKLGISTSSGGPYIFTDIGPGTTKTLSPGKTFYTWSNWDSATKKYTVVKAYNAVFESAMSSELSLGEPSTPTALSASPK